MDLVSGSNAQGKEVVGIVNIHVDDVLMTFAPGAKGDMIKLLSKDFQIGSEDTDDIMFCGQRVYWKDRGKSNQHIVVDQKHKVEELTEVKFDKNLAESSTCDADTHTSYRSVLGQINWLQSRTQYQACYYFSRCASNAAAPNIGHCKQLNKLVRLIRTDDFVLRFWPLKGTCRIIGYPDASYQNNRPDYSSQKGHAIFLGEPRSVKTVNPRASMVDFESSKK